MMDQYHGWKRSLALGSRDIRLDLRAVAHVGGDGQATGGGGPLGRAQVQHDRRLVAGDAGPPQALVAVAHPPAPHGIAGGRFDLDHLGAVVAEELSGEGPGDEAAQLEHPEVLEVGVVGVPHPHHGEAVKAFVVLRPGSAAHEDTLITWCGEHLARYKCPSKITFVDELPRNAMGKVQKNVLRQQFAPWAEQAWARESA